MLTAGPSLNVGDHDVFAAKCDVTPVFALTRFAKFVGMFESSLAFVSKRFIV